MFKGQPKGLFALALANTGERFGYYTMLAIFVLFIQAKFGYSTDKAGQIYGIFLAGVYFMPFLGGMLADKIGFKKCVVAGIITMFAGYACLSVPTDANVAGKIIMFASLFLIAVGTGLFKGNLQVMVGDLYNNPRYSDKRDSAFSLFYMAINIGAMFAPSAATAITNWHLKKFNFEYIGDLPKLCHEFMDKSISEEGLTRLNEYAASMAGTGADSFASDYIEKLSSAYNMGFLVACVSLIVSMAIFVIFKKWYTVEHAEISSDKQVSETKEEVLTPEQTKNRLVALILVFAVVIFFWMAFHQNGLTLTVFARDYTVSSVTGIERLGFNIWALALIAVSVYTIFGFFQSENFKNKIISALSTIALLSGAYALYSNMDDTIHILPQQFQQFNPFYVVALTPVAIAIFSALNKRGKEPSAPKKIASGMFVAAAGFGLMTMASLHLHTPQTAGGPLVGVSTLIFTYLILTFGELLLSPMGISFVSKVAPPKYKGMMMGGWFAATAFGNYLTFIPAKLWDKIPLYLVWTVLMILCIIAGLFLFSIMKKLENATK